MISSPLPVLDNATLQDAKDAVAKLTTVFVVRAQETEKKVEAEFTWRNHRIVIRAYAPTLLTPHEEKKTVQAESLWNYEFNVYPIT